MLELIWYRVKPLLPYIFQLYRKGALNALVDTSLFTIIKYNTNSVFLQLILSKKNTRTQHIW